jgi:hypothetical protein
MQSEGGSLGSRARARLLPVLLAAGGLASAGCGSVGNVDAQPGVDRATPEKTYAYFKSAVQANAYADEWSVFSPNFKKQMSAAAGRHVDVGLYETGRSIMYKNSHPDMQLLINSRLEGVRYEGPDVAIATISAGGQTIRPRLVRMVSWELRVKGDTQPYTDILRNANAVSTGPDGSILVSIPVSQTMAGALRAVPPQSIESLQIETRWYVDDFGGLEGAIGAGAAEPTPQQQPTAPQSPSTAPPSTMPPPPGGFGSPDG